MGRWFQLSLSVQLVLATLLAILPLVVAVAYAAWSLGQQTRVQHQLVLSMAALNHLDASVSEQVKDLERAARQYRLLGETLFLERYHQRLEQLRRSHEHLATMPGLDAEPDVLRELLRVMEEVGWRLEAGHSSNAERPGSGDSIDGELDELRPLLQQAYELSARLSELVGSRLQDSLRAGERQFNAIVWHLVLIGFLAIPGTVMLVAIGSLAIATPVRRLAQAIRDLGHRRWQQPVAIDGPADLLDLGERLDWMRRKLVSSENRSQALLQHITHELKSPLSAITEAGSLLADGVPGELTAAQQRVLEILQDNAQNLHELIRQLLSYNAVTHRNGTILEAVDLHVLCVEQKAKFEAIGKTSGIRWVHPGTPLTVVADPLALQMIMSNLCSNAFHYSPCGGEIRIDWGTAGDNCWLSVADDGPGIAEAEQQSIFKPFVQGTARRRGSVKGSGIGLAIVDECVKAMGGSISVESRPGEGSCFRVAWPVGDGPGPQR